MITVSVTKYNYFTQDFYDSVICSLQFHQLECPSCGHRGCLTIHGYYKRGMLTPDGLVYLRICRVKCSECGCTHALLPSSIVPYSRISTSDQHKIITAYKDHNGRNDVCNDNPSIDENDVKAVIRRYRLYWLQRLFCERIALSPFPNLIRQCFSLYSMQFMQIRRTVNSLFSRPT